MQRQDSPQRSQSAAFTHIERARGTALVGPLVALGVAAGFVAVLLFATESWATWIALAVILLLGAWWAWGARIAVTVNDESVRFRAPLYSREIPLSAQSAVTVEPDDGMNPGSLNWPAVPVRAGATRLIRLNLGGAAAVTCLTQDGSGVQLVVRDLAAAERIARALTHSGAPAR